MQLVLKSCHVLFIMYLMIYRLGTMHKIIVKYSLQFWAIFSYCFVLSFQRQCYFKGKKYSSLADSYSHVQKCFSKTRCFLRNIPHLSENKNNFLEKQKNIALVIETRYVICLQKQANFLGSILGYFILIIRCWKRGVKTTNSW